MPSTSKKQRGSVIRKGMANRRQAAGTEGARNRAAREKGLGVGKNSIPALQKRNGAPSMVLRQVGMEVLRQDLEPAAWARALVEGSGTRDDTLSQYARIRVEALAEQERDRQNRKSDFEVRKKSSFRDMESTPLVPPGGVVKRKVMGCIDAAFWHVVAMVAGVGTLVAANVLWPNLHLDLSWQFLVAAVVAMQLIPFIGWKVGRRGPKGVTYSQAAQFAACLAMLGSMGMGLSLLTRHPPGTELMVGPESPTLETELIWGGKALDEPGDSPADEGPGLEEKVVSSEDR